MTFVTAEQNSEERHYRAFSAIVNNLDYKSFLKEIIFQGEFQTLPPFSYDFSHLYQAWTERRPNNTDVI